MNLFDTTYLRPKKFIPIVLTTFILLNAVGYALAIMSEAHVMAKKAIKAQLSPTETSKVTLLPWGYKISHYDNDVDARFSYHVSDKSGSRKISVLVVRKDGTWKLMQLSPL